MKTAYCILLTVYCLLATGCDITNKIFRKKESTQTETTNHATETTKIEIDSNWSRIGASLLHRDGILRIEFDSIASITIGPDQQIHAIGLNPTILSTTAETRRDTTAELSDTRIRIQEDSTGRKVTSEKKEVLTLEKDKTVKTQKIGPILVLIVLILILVLAVRFFKLIQQ